MVVGDQAEATCLKNWSREGKGEGKASPRRVDVGEEQTAGIAWVAEKEQNNKEICHKRCISFRDNWHCLVRVYWL